MLRHKLAPKHQKLIRQCYPAGRDVEKRPNASELSYLLYYVSSRKAKITKVTTFLDHKTKLDVSRDKVGNIHVTLDIVKALIERCHDELNLFALNVLNILSTVIAKSHSDLTLCQSAAEVYTTFSQYHDGALFSGDSSYGKAFDLLVSQFVSIPQAAAKTAPTAATSIQWRQIGIDAAKALAASPALATPPGQNKIPVLVPLLLTTLQLTRDSKGQTLVRLQKQLAEDPESFARPASTYAVANPLAPSASGNRPAPGPQYPDSDSESEVETGEDVDEDEFNFDSSEPQTPRSPQHYQLHQRPLDLNASPTRGSPAPGPTGNGSLNVPGTSAAPRLSLSGHNQSDDELSNTQQENELLKSALQALLYFFDTTSLVQIRRATFGVISYVMDTNASSPWSTVLLQLVAMSTPVQLRFVILSTLVEKFVGLKSDDVPDQDRMAHMVRFLLGSQVNMVGLSVMDVLRALLRHQVQLLTKGGVSEPPATAPLQPGLASAQRGDLSTPKQRIQAHKEGIQARKEERSDKREARREDRKQARNERRGITKSAGPPPAEKVPAPDSTTLKLVAVTRSAISALATHIYYADQLADMIAELLGRCIPASSEVSNGGAYSLNSAADSQTSSVQSGSTPDRRVVICDLQNIAELLAVARSKSTDSKSRLPLSIWEKSHVLLFSEDTEVVTEYAKVFLNFVDTNYGSSLTNGHKPEDTASKLKGDGHSLKHYVNGIFQSLVEPKVTPSSYVAAYHVLSAVLSAFGYSAVQEVLPRLWYLDEFGVDVIYNRRSSEFVRSQGVYMTSFALAVLAQVAIRLQLEGVSEFVADRIKERISQGVWAAGLHVPIAATVTEDVNRAASVGSAVPSENAVPNDSVRVVPLDRDAVMVRFNVDGVDQDEKSALFQALSPDTDGESSIYTPNGEGKARSLRQLRSGQALSVRYVSVSGQSVISKGEEQYGRELQSRPLRSGSLRQTSRESSIGSSDFRHEFSPHINDLKRAIFGGSAKTQVEHNPQAHARVQRTASFDSHSTNSVHSALSHFDSPPAKVKIPDLDDQVDLNSFLTSLSVAGDDRGRLT